jgi:hypothetical protein
MYSLIKVVKPQEKEHIYFIEVIFYSYGNA